mmetsp:Transcript_29460/g.63168  ORF Transcript_29460/g.63168 Transcript_29460/m.63168 type:complete len:376 (-) Transcript_29460:78-1205(-)
MSEVHDVTGGSGLSEDLFCSFLDRVVVGEQDSGVEVALYSTGTLEAGQFSSLGNAGASFFHVYGPVERHDVGTGSGHALEKSSGVLDVNDGGNIGIVLFDLVEDLLLVRHGELFVVAGRQVSGPGVENLDQLGTVFDLVQGVVSDAVGKILEDGVEQFGLVEGHLFDFEVFLGRLTFDHVGCQCVRASDESEDGGFGADFFSENLEGFGDERSGRGRIDGVHPLDIVPILDGVHDGSELLIDGELTPDSGEGGQDIGEQNASVGLVVSPWLEGDLDGDLGDFAALTEGWVLLAEVTVFLDVSSGLSHHPDGCALDLLALGGTDQERILGVFRILRVLGDGLVDGASDDRAGRGGCGIGGKRFDATGEGQGKKNCR